MFFTLLTFFFFAKPYFTVKRETLRVSLLLFLIFIPAMDYKYYSSLRHSRFHHFSFAQHSLMRRIASRILSSLVA